MIGIQSSLIIFPINLGMTQLFRKSSTATVPAIEEKPKTTPNYSQPKTKTELTIFSRRFGRRPSSLKYLPLPYQLHITSSMSTIISGSESTFNFKTDDTKITDDKKKRHFYRFLYYLAWILCFVSVFVSAFFTLLYSLQWGSERSQQWLLSFFVSFIQDASISQPLKVALFSALLAFVLKFSMEQKEKHRRFKIRKVKTDDDDEGSARSTEVQLGDDVSGDDSLPLQKNVLEKAKLKRMKEIKSSEVMTDVLFYSLFLLLLLIVAYGHRDPIAYEMTNHLENIFSVSVSCFCAFLNSASCGKWSTRSGISWIRHIYLIFDQKWSCSSGVIALSRVQSWPKVFGTLDKMPTSDALFWSGKSLFNFPSPPPPKQCWNSESTLDGSTSLLCWGREGRWTERPKARSVQDFWPGL